MLQPQLGSDLTWRGVDAAFNPVTCDNAPTRRLVKHEDLGARPQMAKRLEDILRSKA